jgi:hypothetical protein
MALSFDAVKKAYDVFAELKRSGVLPDLQVPSWPDDMQKWTNEERETPQEKLVYGFDKKSDSGWENLFFFVRNPSAEVKAKFEELKHRVPNSSMSEPYSRNQKLWLFGWF